MKKLFSVLLFIGMAAAALGQTQPPSQTFSGILFTNKNSMKIDSNLFLPRRDTAAFNAALHAPGNIRWRPADSSLYYYRGNKWGRVALYDDIVNGSVSDQRYSYKSISLNNIDTAHFFGDSYTAGDCASSPNHKYVSILIARWGLVLVDNSLTSTGFYYAAKKANENIHVFNKRAVVAMVGLNDIRRGGDNIKTFRKINAGLSTIIVNAFADSIIPVSAAQVTKTGTWANNPSYNSGAVGDKASTQLGGNTLTSTGSGNKLSMPFLGDEIVVGLFAYDSTNETTGPVTIKVDGTLVTTYDGNGLTDGISDGVNNNRIIPNVVYLSGLGSGAHVIELETSNTNKVIIDYFAKLKTPQKSPPVIIGMIPKLSTAGYALAPANATASLLDKGDSVIKEVVKIFGNRPVAISYTNEFYNPLTDVCVDDIHPNDQGYSHIANAFSNAISTHVITPSLEQVASINKVTQTGITIDRTFIDWVADKVGPPTFSSRSIGTKMVYYPGISPSSVDFGLGVDSFILWHSVPSATNYMYKWYGGVTEWLRLNSIGLQSSVPVEATNNATVVQVIGADTYRVRVGASEINSTLNAGSAELYLNTNGAHVLTGGRLSVGSVVNPTSTLKVSGSFATAATVITGTTTLDATHNNVDVNNSANIIVNLPAIASCPGREYTVSKASNNAFTVTITASGAETINGINTNVLGAQYNSITIWNTGVEWRIK